MKQFVQNEEAVSPVIGVILMVAITVILAAVIAAFVFGMTGSMTTQKNVAITGALNSSSHAVFTIQGGSDLGALISVNYSVDGSDEGYIFESGDVKIGAINGTADAVNGKRVILIGTFADGSQQIIFDKQF